MTAITGFAAFTGVVHPLADEYPLLAADELDAMADDIAANGAAMRRKVRNAVIDLANVGHEVQLAIPGMDHAGLPFIVFDGPRAIPADEATLDQIDAEVRIHERRNATQARIIGGYRITIDALHAQHVSGSTTGSMLNEWFPRVEASASRGSYARNDIAFVALALRDDANCYLCGQGDDPADPLEVEHVRPRAVGGPDVLSNTRLAHRSCNQVKGTRAVS